MRERGNTGTQNHEGRTIITITKNKLEAGT